MITKAEEKELLEQMREYFLILVILFVTLAGLIKFTEVTYVQQPIQEEVFSISALDGEVISEVFLKIQEPQEVIVIAEEPLAQENPVNEEELDLLARAMYAEEGIFLEKFKNNPEKAELVFKLCGSVILNRTEIEYLGCSTIEETLFYENKKGQPQYAKRTINLVKNKEQDVPEIIYQWAEELLRDGPIGPKGLIFQAQFIQGDEVYEHIGNQYFCVSKKYNE